MHAPGVLRATIAMVNGISGISNAVTRPAPRAVRQAAGVTATVATEPRGEVQPIRRVQPAGEDAPVAARSARVNAAVLFRHLVGGGLNNGNALKQLARQRERDDRSATEISPRSEEDNQGDDASGPRSSAGADESTAGGTVGAGAQALTEEERAEVEELQKRDREVRAHEAAHRRAAGDLARGPTSFEFKTGPDGKQYAITGEVQIDTSPVQGDPRTTIGKMQRVRRAALAPAEPSAQDRRVAAEAAATEREARAELARRQKERTEASLPLDASRQLDLVA